MAITEPKAKKTVDASKENPSYTYDIDKDNEKAGFRMPDCDIPEKDKTAQWYVEWVRYICSFYNVPFENILSPGQFNGGDAQAAAFNSENLPVNRMLRYMQYYQGRQDNLDYNHWTTGNVDNSNLQANWIKGQDISELLNFMKGNMLERISNIQITAKALSEDAVSEYQDFRTKLLMKYKFKDIFADMEAKGAQFSVGPNQNFDSEEAIDDFMDKNFKQYGVDVATAMAKHFWYSNYCLSKFLQLFLNACITGVSATQHYVQNGKQYMRTLPSYQMILDTRHDDEFNRDAQFRGIVETMTPSEIFARFKNLTPEQKEEIKKMSRNQDLCISYNAGYTNFNWWNFNLKREEATISVATVYWTGAHDMGLKKAENKFGDTKIEKTKEGEPGEYVLDDVHKASLIGNRFLTDWGYDDNIVEDTQDKSQPMYPILVYLPNMVGGEPRSIVSRLYQLQDEVDAIKFKIREAIGRAKGKCYIIRGSMGNDMKIEEMYKDLGSMGMTVIPAATGENLPGQDARLVEMLDYTLDPNIMRMEEIIKINRELMKEYTSVSNVSLGMQTTYMGMGERNSAIGQSSYGLAALYHGFMDFIQMNLQYSVNVAKNLYTMDGNTEASFTVGDKGVLFLKIMENFKFEDFLVMLQLNDVVDEAGSKSMEQLALGWAQTGVVDPDVYLKLLKEQTYSGRQKVLEYAMKEKKKEQAQQREQEAQQAQAMQAQQLQAQQQNVMLQQGGMDKREGMKADSKIVAAQIQKAPDPTQQQQQA